MDLKTKTLSLFFFPSDIKLVWKVKQKQRELTKIQLFLFLCSFSLKIQDITKSKAPIFKREQHKIFLGQVLSNFQIGPVERRLNQLRNCFMLLLLSLWRNKSHTQQFMLANQNKKEKKFTWNEQCTFNYPCQYDVDVSSTRK